MAISAPAVESAAAELGAGIAAPHPAALAGRSGSEDCAFVGDTYDPECYLCPGNTRAGGETNPPYDSIFTFVNDYARIAARLAGCHGCTRFFAANC